MNLAEWSKNCFHDGKTRWVLFGLLSVCHFAALFHSAAANDYTYDEPLSIVCGMEILQNHNFQMNPESGWLPQVLAALPLMNYAVSPPDPTYDRLTFAQKILFEKYRDSAAAIRLRSRMGMILAGMAALWLLFHISCRLSSSLTALIPPFIFAFTPLFAAHTPLANADMCVSLFFLCSAYAVFRLHHVVNLTHLLGAAAALSLLCLSKMTAPFISVFILLQFFIRVFSRLTVHVRLFRLSLDLKEKRHKFLCLLLVYFVLCPVVLSVIWTAYGFRREFTPLPQERAGTVLFQSEDPVPSLMRFCMADRILPAPYAYGLFFMGRKSSEKITVWYNGESLSESSPALLGSLLIRKLPPPFLLTALLTFAALFMLPFRTSGRKKAILCQPWLAFSILYLAAAFFLWGATSAVRYFLPAILCFLPVMTFSCVPMARSKTATLLFLLLPVWSVTDFICSSPHHLAYVSPLFGGRSKGYLCFSDSSFDWGQDYCNIGTELNRNGIPADVPLYLRYFGTVPPDFPHSGGRTVFPLAVHSHDDFFDFLPGIYMFSATELHRRDWKELLTLARKDPSLIRRLQDFYIHVRQRGTAFHPQVKRYLHARKVLSAELLRQYCCGRTPDFDVNGSILCYVLDQNDLDRAFSRPVE